MRDPASVPVILPGRTIGLLGGGQLGRMFGIAARRMGYRVHALDPSPDCPAGQVADVEINRRYDDLDAARNFANRVDVVTFEFENVPAETLAAIEPLTPVFPSPFVLDTCRHRLREKTFLRDRGFPHADWRPCGSPADVTNAARALNRPTILKSAEFGYDGKGQARLPRPDDASFDAHAAWGKVGVRTDTGRPTAVLEALVPFEGEISVLVARSRDGRSVTYAPGRNEHANGILDVTIVPSGFSVEVEEAARRLAVGIAEEVGLIGLLAVEMFVVGDEVLVNELAPRPHNSGHWTFDAAVTSQFEQQLRMVCGLPPGDVSPTAPAVAMANLLGDVWPNAPGGTPPDPGKPSEPDFAAALTDPGVKLHLYGKTDAKPGRKMGHLVVSGANAAECRTRVLEARRRLRR